MIDRVAIVAAGRRVPERGRSGSALGLPAEIGNPSGAVALSIGPAGIEELGLVEHQRQAGEGEDRKLPNDLIDRPLAVGRTLFTLSEIGAEAAGRLVANREVLDRVSVREAWLPRRPGATAPPATGADSTRH